MRKARELIARATKDFELANRHKRIKEYVTATLLYTSAAEKVLRALFISKTRREPPANTSISYLARHADVPEEVSVYISSMEEDDATADPASITELVESTEGNAEAKAFYMEGLVKRLLDYMYAYAN